MPPRSAQLFPCAALLQVYGQRYIQLNDVLHQVTNIIANRQLVLGNLEYELIVNLKNHPGAKPSLAKLIGDSNHRNLNNVSGGSLNRRIDRGPLGHAAPYAVPRIDFG